MHHNLHYLNFSGHGKHYYRWWRTNFVYSRGKPWFCCRCYYHRCRNNYIQAVQIISHFWNLKVLSVKSFFFHPFLIFYAYCIHWSFILIGPKSWIESFIHRIKQSIKLWNRNFLKWSHFQHKRIVLFSIFFFCLNIYQWIV